MENNDRKTTIESDDSSDDSALYYYAYGSDDSSDDDDHFADGCYDHNHEVVIDFDSGVLTIDEIVDTYNAWGYYIDGQYGTYSEDGYTLAWSTYDYYYDFGNSDNLGAPVFDADNSDDHHADEHSGDFVFGVNYANGNNSLDDGYEFAESILSKDDGGNFGLDGIDFFNTESSTNPNEFNFGQIYTDTYDSGVLVEYQYAYSFDAENWVYVNGTYDDDTSTYIETSNTTDDWDVILDAGLFDDMSSMFLYTYSDIVIDDIELYDVA